MDGFGGRHRHSAIPRSPDLTLLRPVYWLTRPMTTIAVDGRSVDLVFLLLISRRTRRRHLQALAAVSAACAGPRKFCEAAPKSEPPSRPSRRYGAALNHQFDGSWTVIEVMRAGSATRPFQASQAAARRQRKCGEVFRHARLSGGMAAWPPFLFTTEKAGQGRPARTICRTIADARGSDRISLRHAPIGRDNALKSPASREMVGSGRLTMVFRFRRSVVGFVVLGCLAAVTPAAAQKPAASCRCSTSPARPRCRSTRNRRSPPAFR